MNTIRIITRNATAAIFMAAVFAAQVPGVSAAPMRVAERDGYGRIVFDWPVPVRFSADVIGGQLVVQFDRPLTGNVQAAAASLPGYLREGRISPDRRAVSFPLTKTFQMRAITVGTAVVVDLYGQPPLRQELVQRAQEPVPTLSAPPMSASDVVAPAAVTVRNGSHPDYTRVVFDWPQIVPYTVQRQSDRAIITFQRPSGLSIEALRRGLPIELTEASLQIGNGETVVSLPVQPDQEVRHFVNGNSIVFDLVSSAAVATAQLQAPPPPARPVPNNRPTPITPQAEQIAQAPTQQSALRPTSVVPAELMAEQRIPVPPPSRPDLPVGDSRPEPAPQPPETLTDAPVMASASAIASTEDISPVGASPREPSLVIPWNEPAAAAIFRRAGFLWAVFDRYQQLDVDALARAGAPYITYLEQLPYRNNTILRMVTEAGVNPFVRRQGLAWILDFRALPMRPTRNIEIVPQFDRENPNLFLPVSEAGRTIAVEDPEVGDVFLAVPVIPLSYGVFPDRNYPDLEMPTTAQGVVVIPKSDGVTARASRIGINIDREGGVAISRQALSASDSTIAFQSTEEFQRILDLGDWQIGREADYNRTTQALQYALSDERVEVREEARYRLARFQLVNGFLPEALAVLRIMREDAPKIQDSGAFRALRGASNMMMGRYDEALSDFNHYSLANADDVRFWAAIARAQTGDPVVEADTIIRSADIIDDYPRRTKIPLAIIAAEATIDAGDDFGAQGFLDMIREEEPTPHEDAAIAYLDGKLNQKIGELQLALEQYKAAEDGSSRLYQTLASRARFELEHEMGEMSTADLIENLEKLRYRWRGDEIELGILHRLADLYIDQDNYGDALRTLKLSASYFRDDPSVEQVAGRMTEVFAELFLNGAADDLSPITAIALFDEFSNLLPPGNRGDEMIRKLADRLVSVDLLDQAALLLERQVGFRLAGPDRARVGGRLALVHLLNRSPQEALQVLQDTNSGQLTRELQASRRRLQARALTEMSRPDEAIVLLGADMSDESKQLRAEIYWRSENWAAAANAIADMVPTAERGMALNDTDARLILDWATALTLAGDDRTATRIRQRYLAAMEQTPFADAFDLITTPRERGLVDYRTVRQQIEQAENFQSFLVEYEDIIGEEGLSNAIN